MTDESSNLTPAEPGETTTGPITESTPAPAATAIAQENRAAAAVTQPAIAAQAQAATADEPSAAAAAFPLDALAAEPATPSTHTLDLLDDVELDVKIELGRTEMYIEDVLKLGVGSVVELDKLAGDPVDIFVNERLIARGEVLVLNDNFCVRINDIVSAFSENDGK